MVRLHSEYMLLLEYIFTIRMVLVSKQPFMCPNASLDCLLLTYQAAIGCAHTPARKRFVSTTVTTEKFRITDGLRHIAVTLVAQLTSPRL